MITIFNRRELASTYSSARQAALRSALAAAGVDYRFKAVSHSCASMSRARTGSFGQSPAAELQYIIYVRKADWNVAQAVLRSMPPS